MEEARIFDKFEHIGVYVVDRKSLTVYYENALAQKYTGRCRLGEPCYRAYGNDAMCSSCPVRAQNHIRLVNRSDFNMIFAVRSEEVLWDGQEAYLITVVKQGDSALLTEDEKSMSRMSRALQKSVNVYTEINMDTLRYRQINFSNTEGFDVAAEGDYTPAYEYMCTEQIHPADVAEVRRLMAPEVLQRISRESEGLREMSVRYRMKNAVPERIMESRMVFIRDEVPHYVVSMAKDVTRDVQLRRQADAMESILSHVSCGVAVYNADKDANVTVEYANEGLARLAECSKEVLMQQFAADSMFGIDPACRADFSAAFRQIIAGGARADRTLPATTYQGNLIWLHVSLTASQKENGVFQIYGTYVDVSSDMKVQKEFEEKYEVEKRRSQDDATILAYGVFDLQSGRTIEMERRSPFDPVAAPLALEDFCIDIAGSIMSAERKAEFMGMFNAHSLLKNHENGTDEQSIEYQRRLPNGKVIWVKSSFHVIADLSKSTVLLFYYCNDININKSLALMTAYMVDEDYDMLGCINLVDDSAIMLYGKNSSRRTAGQGELQTQERYSEALEWFVNHAVVPEERQYYHAGAFVEQIRRALKEKSVYEFTLHTVDGDGREDSESGEKRRGVRTKKIRYTQNIADADVCFFSQTDITDTLAEEEKKQKQLQEALQSAKQANAAKTSFLSRMSHDMRTPMNGVLGLASLMKKETDPDRLAADLAQLEMSGKYLLQLINDTLDVSKIESGKMELRLKPIDSEMMFGNVFTNASIQAEEKGVALVVTKPEIRHGGWVPVMADAPRLEQIFMNIISNAIKFTPKGGSVEIAMQTLSITDKEVVDQYTIRDSGIGMSEAFLAHIYEPFSQEGRANTSRESGTGLGMSIVKQLVELMQGSISIKSEVGKGTEVTLVMRYPVCVQKPSLPQKEPVDLAALKGRRVLLCEDHPLNAQIAMRLLDKVGVQVVHAENGRIGVERFAASEQGGFDLILMDIRMPQMNGLEAARAIRALDRADAKAVPILAMTANAYEEDVKECLAAGMNAHIAKPIDPKLLYDTLAAYMARR